MDERLLQIWQEPAPVGEVRLRLSGDIDVSVGGELAEALSRAIGGGPSRVVLDMESVGFMDSTGLSAMVRAHNSLHAHGGRLLVRNPSPVVARLLGIVGLDEMFRDDG